MQKSPIFISGIGRSGTSAVISSIAAHKEVITPERVGEAPIVQHFLTFLCEYEETSPQRDYNVKNYLMEAPERARLFSSMISSLQYGRDVSLVPDSEKYWVAKVSLSHDTFDKAMEIFSGLRIIYVIRNGIEVVNSAKHFKGFAGLSFEELCKRWSDSVVELRYLLDKQNCAVIRHDELVSDPHRVFDAVYKKLEMESDAAPAEFIDSTLFNSSFNQVSNKDEVGKVFNNRLSCWNQWSETEQQTFIDTCDEYMQELQFQRPYEPNAEVAMPADNQVQLVPLAVDEDEPWIVSPAGPETDTLGRLAEGCTTFPLLDYHCNVSEKHSYLHMENPKVASTSTLSVLQRQENHLIAAKMTNPHARDESPLSRISSFSEDRQKHFLVDPDVYRFAFVRNPFSRLLSAYLSKIAKPLAPKAEILAIINGTSVSDVTDLTQSVDFPTFVDVVCAQEQLVLNPHWNLQILQLICEKIDYQKIGKFENIEADFAEICTHIFTRKPPELTLSANWTGSTGKVFDYYDEGLIDKVYKKFYDDFHAFDYPASLVALAESA
jgi:hypothetical protein